MAKVSPLNWQIAITNPGGAPTAEFQRAWQEIQNVTGDIPALDTSAEVSAVLDKIGATPGSLLHRGATGWQIITGADGDLLKRGATGWQVLPSSGSGSQYLSGALTWSTPAGPGIQTLLDGISSTRGVVLYRGASAWAALSPGTSGYVLQTNGAGADPSWVAGGGGSPTVPNIVQEMTAIVSSGVGTVALGSAPTAGNLLVALTTHWATTVAAAAGWAKLYDQASASADIVSIFYKQAGSSEPAAQNFSSTSTSWDAALFEIHNAALPSLVSFDGVGSLSGTVATCNAGVPGSAIGIGLFMAQSRAAPTLTITGATGGSTASGTRANGSPSNCQSFSQTGLTAGAWGPSCTFSTTGTNARIAVVLGPKP